VKFLKTFLLGDPTFGGGQRLVRMVSSRSGEFRFFFTQAQNLWYEYSVFVFVFVFVIVFALIFSPLKEKIPLERNIINAEQGMKVTQLGGSENNCQEGDKAG
jgi:hypothetical protein